LSGAAQSPLFLKRFLRRARQRKVGIFNVKQKSKFFAPQHLKNFRQKSCRKSSEKITESALKF
jgi:hypothetical protein